MKKHRDYFIDLLKFVFALLIVLYHSKNLVENEGDSIFIGGVISVEFFFLTSGYYFAKSAAKKTEYYGGTLGRDHAHFMWHKVCGFMPNYLIAWFIAFAVRHTWRPAYSGSIAKDFLQGIKEILFLEETGIGEGGYIVNNVTWYISAMLIAMFLLYPLMRKYKDTFFYIIAPGIAIILFGIMFKDFMNLKKPYAWMWGFIMKGTLRAITEVSIGCVIYKISERLNEVRFTALTKTICSVAALAVWAATIIFMYSHAASKADFDLVIMFAFALTLSVSSLTWFPQIELKGAPAAIVTWLGEFSFSLYLGHGYWSQVFDDIGNFGSMTYKTKLVYYMGIAVATGLFIMYLSKLLKYIWNRNKSWIVPIFVKTRRQAEA